jgi:hypothetical protein
MDYKNILLNPTPEKLIEIGLTEEELGSDLFGEVISCVDSDNIDKAVGLLESVKKMQ